ncbi:MAG: DUF4149 domain-containing protein [Piscirickettsiaceae bacterium]|nr:DUF4149 domain-containing protein [Piscirickettsiaceae bacterium]
MTANLLSERLLLTLWVGSLWAIGYLAVPMAFAIIPDISIAGNYAGRLFSAVNMLGLACGVVLLIAKFVSVGMQAMGLWRVWVLLLMISLSLLFVTYLQPEIAAVKQLIPQGNEVDLERFSLFHMISKNTYMIVSLLGLALVVSSDKVEN